MKKFESKSLYMGVPELAHEFDISRSQAYKLLHAGLVDARRIGGSIRVLRSSVEKLVAETGKLEE
jgi:hypothetical protein